MKRTSLRSILNLSKKLNDGWNKKTIFHFTNDHDENIMTPTKLLGGWWSIIDLAINRIREKGNDIEMSLIRDRGGDFITPNNLFIIMTELNNLVNILSEGETQKEELAEV